MASAGMIRQAPGTWRDRMPRTSATTNKAIASAVKPNAPYMGRAWAQSTPEDGFPPTHYAKVSTTRLPHRQYRPAAKRPDTTASTASAFGVLSTGEAPCVA